MRKLSWIILSVFLLSGCGTLCDNSCSCRSMYCDSHSASHPSNWNNTISQDKYEEWSVTHPSDWNNTLK